MRKVVIRNTRRKAFTIVLDPKVYEGAPRAGMVAQSITVRGGSDSTPLHPSVANLPQVRALRQRGALRIVAAPAESQAEAKPKPQAETSSKRGGKKSKKD